MHRRTSGGFMTGCAVAANAIMDYLTTSLASNKCCLNQSLIRSEFQSTCTPRPERDSAHGSDTQCNPIEEAGAYSLIDELKSDIGPNHGQGGGALWRSPGQARHWCTTHSLHYPS